MILSMDDVKGFFNVNEVNVPSFLTFCTVFNDVSHSKDQVSMSSRSE